MVHQKLRNESFLPHYNTFDGLCLVYGCDFDPGCVFGQCSYHLRSLTERKSHSDRQSLLSFNYSVYAIRYIRYSSKGKKGRSIGAKIKQQERKDDEEEDEKTIITLGRT